MSKKRKHIPVGTRAVVMMDYSGPDPWGKDPHRSHAATDITYDLDGDDSNIILIKTDLPEPPGDIFVVQFNGELYNGLGDRLWEIVEE